jgi:hypothetical protein
MNASVSIQLFKGTTKVQDIAKNAANNGAFNWAIPTSRPAGSKYKIKIKTVDGFVNGTSGLFSLN